MKYIHVVIWVIGLIYLSKSNAETLQEFSERCESELEIPMTIPGFNCQSGEILPTTMFGNSCDAEAMLGGVGCAEGSRLGKLELQNDDVQGVFICRKYASDNIPVNDNRYSDIALIIQNTQNGKTCFFQSKLSGTLSGNVPAPKNDRNNGTWLTPQSASNIGCDRCHSNDAFIITPHVAEAFKSLNVLEKLNPKGPYHFVGLDFNRFEDSRTEGCAGACHYNSSSGSMTDYEAAAINVGWMPPVESGPWDPEFSNSSELTCELGDWVRYTSEQFHFRDTNIKNKSESPIGNWEATITFPSNPKRIYDHWAVDMTLTGNILKVKPKSWVSALQPEGQLKFDLQGEYTGDLDKIECQVVKK